MNPRLVPVGTFFLGVVLTVGAYETVRLVTNARNALALASGQSIAPEDEELAEAEPDRRRRAVTRSPDLSARRSRTDLQAAPLQTARRAAPIARPTPARAPTPAERRERLEERMEGMTELERQEFLELRRARRDRRRGGKARAVPRAPVAATEAGLEDEPVDTADEGLPAAP